MSPTKRLILCCGFTRRQFKRPAGDAVPTNAMHPTITKSRQPGSGTALAPPAAPAPKLFFPLAVVADVNGTRDIIVLQHTAVGSEIVSVHGIVGRVDHAVAVVIARRTTSGQAEQQAGSRRLERIEA